MFLSPRIALDRLHDLVVSGAIIPYEDHHP